MKKSSRSSSNNQQGFMMIGLSMAIVAIIAILIFSIQRNMEKFYAEFNRSKAYYDAEIAIDRLAIQLKNAYERAQKIQPAVGNIFYFPVADNKLGKFNYKSNKICVDRSDGNFDPICIDFDPATIEVKTISHIDWNHRWEAFKWATLKTFSEIPPSYARAQELVAYQPTLPGNSPSIPLTYVMTQVDVTDSYGNFHCDLPRPAGSVVAECVTFRFCTKIHGTCSSQEWVYQTLLFNETPKTHLEN